MDFELNRELQEDSDLSDPDDHVLVALNGAPSGRLQQLLDRAARRSTEGRSS